MSVVHHGSLTVPLGVERDYELAKAYLCRDAQERAIFFKLEHSHGRPFRLQPNARSDDRFDPNSV